MQAVTYDGAGGVVVRDVPEPTIDEPTDAIVAVRWASVCGTDLHLLDDPAGLPEGFVMGHEFVGEVVEVGRGVHSVGVGDLVVAGDYTACGSCWFCRRGEHWHCASRAFFGTGTTFGPALPGGQAELVRVPMADTTLRRIPAGLDPSHAVLVGDALATGYAAARVCAPLPGDCVAVVGGGPVGQLTALVAQALGAGTVVLTDMDATRRGVASSLGSVSCSPAEAPDVIIELTDGRGADSVVDAVGGAAILDAALPLLRKGGRLVSVGVPREAAWDLPLTAAFTAGISIDFVVGNMLRDADPLLAMLGTGLLDPSPLVTTRLPLTRAAEAYSAVRNRTTLKPLIYP
ncbi:alcohol dehydrogenase catalytic domain-containing protein [Ornithinicoccus hortensis]|uniref:2-desacetyl-2-hydroxyethyl bacteriochlorophyllide A dehydrogenase n=1 Tax=Ornithinicoccus hortensis TaxID=82346 RepID=A0A542YTC9_9MICO|nr:alcohol dehydrogenase catalytic domain-containing protein [Ornithinicoccus hortensis]TQL51353.1 2-desacetyl-2-hydroxyethyl bacteriochlorophyllide A dehydrogenase [Ornithinicoccus hortensis]